MVRNAYGDVVMLVSGTTIIAYYEYDAWGNCKVYNLNGTINAESDFIGNINPFRWKGHYYDVESGLYYANGSYYDPEVGVHVDAASISSIINNAFEVFGLDINGIMCDNILAYLPYVYSAFTTLELMADPEYDPDLNKPWWELAWNALVSWFASVVQWFNNLDVGWKIGIGLALFALACIITALTAGLSGGAAAIAPALLKVFLDFAIGVVSAFAFTAISMAITGDFSLETLGGAVADAIFWGGVFAFVSASVNVIKQLTRNARAMRLAKKGDYDKLAEMFTHNKNADKVILGKWDNGASTSYVARAGKDYTYYQMPTKIWNDIANVPNIDMWEINKAFLNQQISLGKQFYASHIMANAAGAFGKEITYIGISNIIQLYF